MSRSGVPSRQSSPITERVVPSTLSSRTTLIAIGLGRAGERRAKVPCCCSLRRGTCRTRFLGDLSIQYNSTRWLHVATSLSPSAQRGSSSTVQIASDSRAFFGQSLRSEEHTSELQSHSDIVCRL